MSMEAASSEPSSEAPAHAGDVHEAVVQACAVGASTVGHGQSGIIPNGLTGPWQCSPHALHSGTPVPSLINMNFPLFAARNRCLLPNTSLLRAYRGP